MTGVAEFLYRKLGRPPDGGDWADQVRGTFVQLQDFIQTHPNAAPLLVRDLASSAVAKKRANVLMRIVLRSGADPIQSAILVSNLVALLVGHTLLALWVQEEAELSGEAGDTRGDGDGARRVWIRRMFPPGASGSGDIGPSESGVLTTSVQAGELSTDAIFLAGVDAIIAGFAADSSPSIGLVSDQG